MTKYVYRHCFLNRNVGLLPALGAQINQRNALYRCIMRHVSITFKYGAWLLYRELWSFRAIDFVTRRENIICALYLVNVFLHGCRCAYFFARPILLFSHCKWRRMFSAIDLFNTHRRRIQWRMPRLPRPCISPARKRF